LKNRNSRERNLISIPNLEEDQNIIYPNIN
jgi:hypothetical protein